MARTRSNRKSLMKSIKRVTSEALPVVDKGLNTVGNVTKTLVKKSVPVVEKGVSAVYGTMSTGFDLGVKGVKSVANSVKMSKKRNQKKGGRRRRTRTRRH